MTQGVLRSSIAHPPLGVAPNGRSMCGAHTGEFNSAGVRVCARFRSGGFPQPSNFELVSQQF